LASAAQTTRRKTSKAAEPIIRIDKATRAGMDRPGTSDGVASTVSVIWAALVASAVGHRPRAGHRHALTRRAGIERRRDSHHRKGQV
jgi:hypothetical protein